MERKVTITVWQTDAPFADSQWAACFDDYDLDCHTGTGPSPEEAIIELISLWDLPKSGTQAKENHHP
jgi:hypothetical protein